MIYGAHGIAILVAFLQTGQTEPAAPLRAIPQPLVAMFEGRKAVSSGRFAFARTVGSAPHETQQFVARYAKNGDSIFERRGDLEGWTIRKPDGSGLHRFPQLFLSNRDGFWKTQETGVSAYWWGRDGTGDPWHGEVKDIRGLGLGCGSGTLQYAPAGIDAITDVGGVRLLNWTESTEDGLIVVAAVYEDNVRQHWYINPRKGWQAERVSVEIGERVIDECRSMLHECDGVWFPETVQYFREGKLAETFVVSSASINRADDPPAFGPPDVGIEPGMEVWRQNLRKDKDEIWDGDRLVAMNEWFAAVKDGTRQWGPKRKRMIDGEPYDSPYMTDAQREESKIMIRDAQLRSKSQVHDGLWTKYVRDFCEKYALDGQQRQKATVILNQCQNEADDYTKAKRNAFNEAFESLEKASKADDAAARGTANHRMEELRRPIDDIFEKKLKPRLDKLPTREQRKQAEQASPVASPP